MARRALASIVASLIASGMLLGAVSASAAPDPGGDETAAVQLPPAAKEFGFNGLFNADGVFNDGPDATAQASLVARAGGNAVRMPLDWWGVEPQQDIWNEDAWSRHAAAYRAMLAAGITPHFTLQDAPPWARDAGDPQLCTQRDVCNYPPSRDMLGQWAEFVKAVARRFPQATIEIWNEPNSGGQWRSGVDPARYAQLLARAYEAAKSVNPQGEVIMGGLGASTGSGWLPLRDFLDQAYAATPSLKGHTDAINIHTYPFGRLGEGTLFAQLFDDVRAIRTQYGDGATPIFVSETGVTTSGPNAVGEADQADMLLRAVRKLLTMPDVDGVLVNTLLDRPEHAASDNEYGFGVLHWSSTLPLDPKRAYCQLTRAAGSLYSRCPPLAVILGGPQGPTNQSTASFRFTSTETASGFECSLDGAPFARCTSPVSYGSLADGRHTFAVRALGAGGRVDPDPITRSFDLDTVAPSTALAGPSGPINDDTPTFWPATDDSNARVECSLNGGPYAPCAGSYEPGPLADGGYVVRARAVDPAGNNDPSPPPRAVTGDPPRPVATITAGPDGPTTDTSPRFEFASDEPGSSFRCSFNANPLGPCAEPNAHYPAGSYSDGTYTFRVVAIDPAGNWSAKAVRTFEVDTHGPVTTVTLPPSPIASHRPALELAADEAGSTFECRFDGADFAPCAAEVTAPWLANGDHAFEARAVDSLGNRGAVERTIFTVDAGLDTEGPVTSIDSGPEGSTSDPQPAIGFSSPGSGVTFECSFDDEPFRACSEPGLDRPVAPLTEGSHSFAVRARDSAGNAGPPAGRSFVVDLTAPETAVRVAGHPRRAKRRVRPKASEAGSRFVCALDHGGYRRCSSPYRTPRLRRGRHRVRVKAIDAAGNVDPTPAVTTFRVR